MKKFTFFLLLISGSIYAQSWTYANVGQKYSDENGISCSVKDSLDNTYLAGYFASCYHCDNIDGVFITKINSNGVIVWTDTITAPVISIKTILIKQDGKVSITGYFTDTISFNGFILYGGQYYKGFYSEYSPLGNCLSADTLAYIPLGIIKNIDNSYSIAGESSIPVTNLNHLAPSGHFIGNFTDYNTANWIHDLPGTLYFTANNAIASSAFNTIYFAGGGHISKHTATGGMNISTSIQSRLEFKNNKLYGLTGTYWGGNTTTVFDTTGVVLYQNTFGNTCFVQSMLSYKGGYVIGGTFTDSLICNGSVINSDTSGLRHMFLIQFDSMWSIQNVHIVKEIYSYLSPGGIWPDFLSTNGDDIFVQGPIRAKAVFGNDTLMGDCCDYSRWYYAKLSSTTVGVPEEKVLSTSFKIYPNPSSGNLIIYLDRSGDSKNCVRDIFGKCLYTSTLKNSHNLDLSELAKGVYFIEVNTLNKLEIKKIILQ